MLNRGHLTMIQGSTWLKIETPMTPTIGGGGVEKNMPLPSLLLGHSN
jgi:hypothetical protein